MSKRGGGVGGLRYPTFKGSCSVLQWIIPASLDPPPSVDDHSTDADCKKTNKVSITVTNSHKLDNLGV